MAGNSFGKIFRITTFGESHGNGIGVVIDGCPSGVLLDTEAIQRELTRRRPGQSRLTTQRRESDIFEILSGVVENTTTGAPIAIWIANKDMRSKDYSHLEHKFRPSHADYTYQAKYGLRDVRGGGRSSARETAARVAAGAIARQILSMVGIEITAWVCRVGQVEMSSDRKHWSVDEVERTPVRCPEQAVAESMIQEIDSARKAGDTVGGVIECVVKNCPPGLGEPVYDKLHAELGKAILSINACKGFETGSGFRGATMRGSEHNDEFFEQDGVIKTRTNHSGGIQGGISNGMDIAFRAAFKPVSTLMVEQRSVDSDGNEVTVQGKGRHDPCVVPRAVPIVEAMTAIVIADFYLRSKASGPINLGHQEG